ncbi:MAG: hypothetical protein ABIQ39_08485 [Ilumatobacteraceae bacterium]
MTTFRAGDRIRMEVTDSNGLPLVCYGFIGAATDALGQLMVMLDGEITGTFIDPVYVHLVDLTTVELLLRGADLIDDPELRRGLVALWQAEADSAGLDVGSLRSMGEGWPDAFGCWALAELAAGDDRYVVHASRLPHDPDAICVRADPLIN